MFPFVNFNFYSFFLGLGFFLGLSYFFFFLWRKKFPNLWTLFFLFFLSFPFGLFGARLWTYLFSDILRTTIDNLPTTKLKFERFFGLDSEKGLDGLSIHGAIVFATAYFALVFFWHGHKYQIAFSYYFDVLIRAALIAQIVGRWGNFFNQELLGDVITNDYSQEYGWIPEWFAQKLHLPHLETSETIRHPLFLYESLGNLFLFILLVFLLPKIMLLFNYHHIINSALFCQKNSKFLKKKSQLSFWYKFWAFFYQLYLVDQFYKKQIYNLTPTGKKLPLISVSQNKFWNSEIFPSFTSSNYLQEQQKIYVSINGFMKKKYLLFLLWLRRDSRHLSNFFNPSSLIFIRLGAATFFYLFGYGVLRLILQSYRELNLANHVMDITNPTSILFIILGVLGFLFSQFVIPYKWRKKGYLYESWYL